MFRTLPSLRHVQWRGDLVAGLTLAAIAIPEQMATARLAGFPPQVGFIAFIIGSLAFALLGSSRVRFGRRRLDNRADLCWRAGTNCGVGEPNTIMRSPAFSLSLSARR